MTKPKPPAKKPAAKGVRPPKSKTPFQHWREGDAPLEELCSHIASGGHLNGFCKARGIPYTTMLGWINADSAPARAEMYARAREDRADLLADEILDIADDAKGDIYIDDDGVERTNHEVVARAKLRVDARKWIACKLKPRVYGDKLQQEVTGKDGRPVEFTEIRRTVVDPKP